MERKRINYLQKTCHRTILERLLFRYSNNIREKILDIGSKNRRYDHLFQGEITAIDIVPNEQKKVIQANVEEKLDFPDNSFDSVLCLEVFEYLDKYEIALKEIQRVVKPGGMACITMPFMYPDHSDAIRFTKQFAHKKFSAYFEIVECLQIGNTYTVISDIIRRKIISIRSRFIRSFFKIVFLPSFLILKFFYALSKKDDCYSGLFFILRKNV
jgi:SAM-dependent methyltransferase